MLSFVGLVNTLCCLIWGLRTRSTTTASVFDPISYHQGSVAAAGSRAGRRLLSIDAGRPLAGYAALMRNVVDLTWIQDPGYCLREVLSGAFFSRLTQRSAHQLWSSAMILPATSGGCLELDVDALHRTLSISSCVCLPCKFRRTFQRPGSAMISARLAFTREHDHLLVVVHQRRSLPCFASTARARPAGIEPPRPETSPCRCPRSKSSCRINNCRRAVA